MRFAQFYVALEGALAKLAGALVLLAVMLITVNAMMRYALNAPINWVDQFSGYFLVYATFLAAPWVLAKRGHVAIDVLRESLGPVGQRRLDVVVNLLGLVYCLAFTWISVLEVVRVYSRNTAFFDVVTVPQWPIYIVIPIGGLLLCGQFLLNILLPPPAAGGNAYGTEL